MCNQSEKEMKPFLTKGLGWLLGDQFWKISKKIVAPKVPDSRRDFLKRFLGTNRLFSYFSGKQKELQ